MTATAVRVSPSGTPSNRPPTRVVIGAIAIAAAVTAVLLVLLTWRERIWMLEIDFKVYNLAGRAVLNGTSPYDPATTDGFLFIYPPITALLFAPLGLLSVDVGFAIWTFGTVLALQAAVWLAFGMVAPDEPARRARFTLLAPVVAIPTAALVMHLHVGQIGALLMFLVFADLAGLTGRFKGVAIGFAAGLKLLPLIFVGYLLLTRRIRTAGVAMVTFAATVSLGYLVMPGPSGEWWGHLMLNTGRMIPPGAAPFEQSLSGVLGQLPGVLHERWLWLVLAILIGIAGLGISVWASRRGLEVAGIFACAVTSLVVSPVSWPDHFVWMVPGLALWLLWARRRRSTLHTTGVALAWLVMAAAGVLIFLLVVGVPELSLAQVEMRGALTALVVLNGVTLLGCLGYLATLATVLWRRDRTTEAGRSGLRPEVPTGWTG